MPTQFCPGSQVDYTNRGHIEKWVFPRRTVSRRVRRVRVTVDRSSVTILSYLYTTIPTDDRVKRPTDSNDRFDAAAPDETRRDALGRRLTEATPTLLDSSNEVLFRGFWPHSRRADPAVGF